MNRETYAIRLYGFIYSGIKVYGATFENENRSDLNFAGGHLSVVSDVPYTGNMLRVGLAVDFSLEGIELDEYGDKIYSPRYYSSLEVNFSLDILPFFKSVLKAK